MLSLCSTEYRGPVEGLRSEALMVTYVKSHKENTGSKEDVFSASINVCYQHGWSQCEWESVWD